SRGQAFAADAAVPRSRTVFASGACQSGRQVCVLFRRHHGAEDILKAVKKSIDVGLAPDTALRALTLSAAEIFGVSDRLGSVENGKIANLVVTDGDLFEEKTKIKMVFVDGRRFEIREPEKPKEPPKGDITGKWKL